MSGLHLNVTMDQPLKKKTTTKKLHDKTPFLKKTFCGLDPIGFMVMLSFNNAYILN